MSFRRGRRLGVDVGSVRIGIATCDPDGILASPLTTVSRGDKDYQRIAELAAEYEVIEVLVGLPLTLKGEDGPAAIQVREFARQLARWVNVPVRLVDERLTTVSAQRSLRSAGRNTRESKSTIDAASAAVIVESAIETEKKTAKPAGHVIAAE